MMTKGLAALLLAPIAGCGSYDPELVDNIEVVRYEYDAVRAMEPQGPAFNQGLRQGYLDYGDMQYDEVDVRDFIHFAFKAVDSAKGETVLPDEIGERTIPAGAVDELTLARARLMGAFEQGGRKKAPWEAAGAQTAFDCWIERTEEGAIRALIEECKARFGEQLAAMEDSLSGDLGGAHLVFFPWDQADLTPVALATLDSLLSKLGRSSRTRPLTVAGHTDSSGSEAYNDRLSKARAEAVADALAARGLAGGVKVEWYGESKPRIELPDGTREQENRRVEIIP
ncbi:MAG: OmpA family protein [Rhizobiales bacterium]|nr:OmpA family protein [Hyphomicrobiales bacterium]